MATYKLSKLAVLGPNAVLGLTLAAVSALASDMPKSDLPPQSTPEQATQPISAPVPNVTVGPVAKFEELDKNKDGFLSKDEIPATLDLTRTFANYDLNADARLDKGEYGKYKAWKDELARTKNSNNKRQ